MISNHVFFFDTTLRDGEQSPGCSMTTQEKLTMAHALEDLGVDIIEAGFAMASEGDFAAIATITQAVRKPRIASLARAKTEDIEMAARALQFADRARIHVFLASSDLHLEYKLKIGRAGGAGPDRRIGAPGRSLVSTTSSSRPKTPPARTATFWSRWCASPSRPAPPPSTCPTPWATPPPKSTASMFREVRERVPAIDAQGIVLSSHCHDDLGLAVANSLAAIQAGARQVECTINGIGERAGNAALEEIAAALYVRGDRFGVTTGIKLESLSHQPGAGPAHHLPPLAQQGHRGRQRLCARVRHSSARHAGQPALLRDHDPVAGGRGQEPSGARQALRPRRAAQSLGAAWLHAHPRRVATHLLPLRGPGRPQKEHLRPGSDWDSCPIRFAKNAASRSPNSIEPHPQCAIAWQANGKTLYNL
jgi:hypothetical protein